jgi:hypothetical protein
MSKFYHLTNPVTEKRLRMFANYLKESKEIIDSYSDGQMESAIKYAKQEVMNEIGDMLEEILDIDEKEIIAEIKREGIKL